MRNKMRIPITGVMQLLFFLFIVLSAGSAFAITSDDFHTPELNTNVWTFINPRNDASFSITGAGTPDALLSISVLGGSSHDVWTTGNMAPRIMQSANNTDFEVEVKFQSSLTAQYQMEGIIIQQDGNNFIRFDIVRDATSTRAFAASFVNGSPTVRINVAITPGNPLYLRVKREGNLWTQFYSYNGTSWISAGSFSHMMTVTSIGPFAGNHGNPVSASPAFTCLIDYFFNAASPIIPEDSAGPVIISHPANQSVSEGQTATFNVVATGTQPLSYQWQKNGVNISGATSTSYTTPAATLNDNGATFRCVVSNSLGNATSNTATLTVTSTPPQNKQLLLLDRTFVHSTSYSAALLGETPSPTNPNCIYVTGIAYTPGVPGSNVCNHEAFKFFQMPASNPSSWTSPIDYAHGTLYQRVQIISKPTTTPVRYAVCMFQDQVLAPRHACGDLSKIAFTGPGTYYSSQAMNTMYQYSTAIDWTRKPHVIMLHMTDKNNHQPDSYPGFMDLWYGTPNWSLYYPMTLRYTAIIVPPGGGAPVWP